jgi:hypothetical protein
MIFCTQARRFTAEYAESAENAIVTQRSAEGSSLHPKQARFFGRPQNDRGLVNLGVLRGKLP